MAAVGMVNYLGQVDQCMPGTSFDQNAKNEILIQEYREMLVL